METWPCLPEAPHGLEGTGCRQSPLMLLLPTQISKSRGYSLAPMRRRLTAHHGLNSGASSIVTFNLGLRVEATVSPAAPMVSARTSPQASAATQTGPSVSAALESDCLSFEVPLLPGPLRVTVVYAAWLRFEVRPPKTLQNWWQSASRNKQEVCVTYKQTHMIRCEKGRTGLW